MALDVVHVELPAARQPVADNESHTRGYTPSKNGIQHAILSKKRSAVTEHSLADESCFSLGPFSNRASLIKAKAILLGKVRPVSVRAINQQAAAAYWVYLPPYASLAQAQGVARRLKKKGYLDYFIVAGNQNANAISLGLFKEQRGAERRLTRVKGLGFPARIATQYQTVTLYWLDYVQSSNVPLDSNKWRGVNGGAGELQILHRSCPVSAKSLS
ncbi:SPOR domain-containing protein [Acidihalobacter yilgarnensis]|uniref:SPOR domain-containing protein n=1 Tax=Acidihalobacter yilgarnensis TaxID=2819280 RepID=UPI0009F3F9F8|nr:SPOR domain-containing protein [Acidihalobacter yilgarnensis]